MWNLRGETPYCTCPAKSAVQLKTDHADHPERRLRVSAA